MKPQPFMHRTATAWWWLGWIFSRHDAVRIYRRWRADGFPFRASARVAGRTAATRPLLPGEPARWWEQEKIVAHIQRDTAGQR